MLCAGDRPRIFKCERQFRLLENVNKNRFEICDEKIGFPRVITLVCVEWSVCQWASAPVRATRSVESIRCTVFRVDRHRIVKHYCGKILADFSATNQLDEIV